MMCYVLSVAKIIPQRELRNDNAKVIDAVASGQTFVVTRNGEPVAELRPVQAARRTFLTRGQLLRMANADIRIDRQQFRDDLDHAIDQDF
jgi:prevent-host-death family protein